VVGAVAAPVLVKPWALNAVVEASAGVYGPCTNGRILNLQLEAGAEAPTRF